MICIRKEFELFKELIAEDLEKAEQATEEAAMTEVKRKFEEEEKEEARFALVSLSLLIQLQKEERTDGSTQREIITVETIKATTREARRQEKEGR